MCEENWADVTNELLETTFLIPVCLSRPSQQTIEYRLLGTTPPPETEGKGPSAPNEEVRTYEEVSVMDAIRESKPESPWTLVVHVIIGPRVGLWNDDK
ncbi:hypothetical protein CDAR_616871 [Caerostris darwini]|uniref:Uncharacterized protein n=1 Tax=Caerostris darwini TaxID=1538125 RepID=A0AAV4RZZ6_9ARAC|nr:hypothetical protein CDAR_616871 [Caerostris darwini]